MQGLLDKSGGTIKRIYQRWGIGVFALPALLAIALVGLAMTPRAATNWISQAAEAEFAGTKYRPEANPAQPAKPVIEIRTVYPATRLAPRSIVNSTSIRPRE
jgi:hypothetical protein